MIAGGTGITPMLQIIRAVIRGRKSGDVTQIDLIFANVNEEDILLREDLDTLAKQDEGFRVHYVLNNPPEKWDGGVGFVTPEMITVCLFSVLIFHGIVILDAEGSADCACRNGCLSPQMTLSSYCVGLLL